VAQRRRRVFVVGCAGDWRAAAAVLFERHSLQGHPAPSREKGKGVAPSTGFSVTGSVTGGFGPKLGTDEACQGSLIPAMHSEISPALKARDAKGPSSDGDGAILVPMSRPMAFGVSEKADVSHCLRSGASKADKHESTTYVAQPIALQDVRAVEKMQNGKGWNDDGTAYTVDTHATQGVMQPIPFDTTQITSKANYSKPQAGDPCHPLAAGAHPPAICLMDQGGSVMTIENDITGTLRRETHGHEPVVMQPIAFSRNDDGRDATHNLAPTMRVAGNAGGVLGIAQAMAVRRLTCRECERLQGFPDGYTDIQPKGKATPDGPRYKALGNSMAVPVMRWIGERIAQVEGIA